MIDSTILKYLEHKAPQLDFKGLIQFMVDSDITFTDSWLVSSSAITTLDGILLDIKKISNYRDSRVFFIILHEIGHYKRMKKLGRTEVIRRLSSDNFNDYSEFLINEEMIADRYARMLFFKFNGVILPIEYTQQLEVAALKMHYQFNLLKNFGVVQNDEGKYYELINSYIIV